MKFTQRTLRFAMNAKKNINIIMHENDIATEILDAAFTVHREVGPGLLESAYEAALSYELGKLNLDVKNQLPVPFIYKEIKQEIGYRIDLLVEDRVIVEVKSVEQLVPVHFAQLLTYLKLSNKKIRTFN
jgi:GxxExxY protein